MTRVRQARAEIVIATRRFEFDAFGQMLLSELEYACQRGLRVCCLLDADGCASFIENHPTLFTALETRFRIQTANAAPVTLLAFDRSYALTGHFPLCAAIFSEGQPFESCTGEPATMLALGFDGSWNAAVDPRQSAS